MKEEEKITEKAADIEKLNKDLEDLKKKLMSEKMIKDATIKKLEQVCLVHKSTSGVLTSLSCTRSDY